MATQILALGQNDTSAKSWVAGTAARKLCTAAACVSLNVDRSDVYLINVVFSIVKDLSRTRAPVTHASRIHCHTAHTCGASLQTPGTAVADTHLPPCRPTVSQALRRVRGTRETLCPAELTCSPLGEAEMG